MQSSSPELRQKDEAELLLSAIPKRAVTVVLDSGGRMLSSEDFARQLGGWRDDGVPCVAFLIGGAEGHGDAVLKQADLRLSFGAMIWPHMLVRAMLAEQRLWVEQREHGVGDRRELARKLCLLSRRNRLHQSWH